MAMCVTEKMVEAAHRQLPGISNRVRVRQALEAAAALAEDPAQPLETPVPVRLRLQVDDEQLRADVAAIIAQQQATLDEPHVTPDGLDGPGVTDATGQTPVTINEPKVYAGVAEIAAHFMAGRSTVAGWVKNAADNGMPAPLAILAAGPVYDLDAVIAWHAAWKARA
jgi:hypothetical protein